MKTLNKATTSQFFIDQENGYDILQRKWKALLSFKANSLSAEHFMLYAILRGKDWRKGFTRKTNIKKITNGQKVYGGAWLAKARLVNQHRGNVVFSIFDGIVTPESREIVASLLADFSMDGPLPEYKDSACKTSPTSTSSSEQTSTRPTSLSNALTQAS